MSKDLRELSGLPLAPYAGLSFGTFDDSLRFVGGLNVALHDRLSATLVFDGIHGHLLLNSALARGLSFTFLLVRGKHPGASLSASF